MFILHNKLFLLKLTHLNLYESINSALENFTLKGKTQFLQFIAFLPCRAGIWDLNPPQPLDSNSTTKETMGFQQGPFSYDHLLLWDQFYFVKMV